MNLLSQLSNMDEARVALLMIGGFFSLFGTAFVLIGLPFLSREKRFARRGVQTDAKVVRVDYFKGSFFPVLSYYANGQWVENRSTVGCSPCPYREGDQVTIWYLPNKPRRYAIEGDRPSKILGGVFIGLGVVFFLIGLFLLALFVRG